MNLVIAVLIFVISVESGTCVEFECCAKCYKNITLWFDTERSYLTEIYRTMRHKYDIVKQIFIPGRITTFLHYLIRHQPHTHLIHRVIKSWLLIKVLIETIQTTQRGNLIALKTRKNFLVHDMQNHVPLVFLGKYGRISKLTNFFFSCWFNKQKCSATVYLIL